MNEKKKRIEKSTFNEKNSSKFTEMKELYGRIKQDKNSYFQNGRSLCVNLVYNVSLYD